MDLETIRAADRINKFREGKTYSKDVKEQLEKLSGLSYEEKAQLMADVFNRALPIADTLVSRPEYNEEAGILDLTAHGLGEVKLHVYHDDGDDETEAFDGIAVDIDGVYAQHSSISELKDDMVFVRRDGTVEKTYEDFDRHVHATLEYLETLEVIQHQLASE